MTRKMVLLEFLILAMFLVALLARKGTLILLSLPFLTYIMMGVLRFPPEIQLRAVRVQERVRASAGEPVEMSVHVENTGRSRAYFGLRDPLLPSMELLEGQFSQHFLLSPGEQATLKYTFRAGRGRYVWKSIRVLATDPFALFELDSEFPAAGKLLIRPEPDRLDHLPLRPLFTRHIPGSMPTRLAGSGTTFLGVREYQAGDPLRRLHWRMIARHPRRLFTKVFEQDEVTDIGLVLDARSQETGRDSLFEYAVRATASLAEMFLRDSNRVGLLVYGEEMEPLFPGSGKRQLNRVYDSLAQVSASRSIPFEYLEYLSSRLFPSRSIVFVISSQGYRELPAYERLLAAGHTVVLICPDLTGHVAGKLPLHPVYSLAYRAHKLERWVQLRQLANLGIRVIDWPVGRALNSVLRETLTRTLSSHPRHMRR